MPRTANPSSDRREVHTKLREKGEKEESSSLGDRKGGGEIEPISSEKKRKIGREDYLFLQNYTPSFSYSAKKGAERGKEKKGKAVSRRTKRREDFPHSKKKRGEVVVFSSESLAYIWERVTLLYLIGRVMWKGKKRKEELDVPSLHRPRTAEKREGS